MAAIKLLVAIALCFGFTLASSAHLSPTVDHNHDDLFVFQATALLDQALHEIDERFLSYTIDISAVLADPQSLHDPRLLNIASYLSPAYLRIGGTTQDQCEYVLGDDNQSDSDNMFRTAMPDTVVVDSVGSTQSEWGNAQKLKSVHMEAIHTFVNGTGSDLVFGVNAAWPRDDEGEWTVDNAVTLLDYVKKNGIRVAAWELGNEPNSFFQKFGDVSPQSLARQFMKFRELLDASAMSSNGDGSRPFLMGPDPSTSIYGVWNLPQYMNQFLAELDRSGGVSKFIDAATWHFYPLAKQSTRRWDNATRDNLLNPLYLNFFSDHAVNTQRETQRISGKDFPVWIGEASSISGGGLSGVSNTFYNGFWYLDVLSRFAQIGSGFMRQSLIGDGYELIGKEGGEFVPRPDFWLALVWKQLVGRHSIPVRQTSSTLSDVGDNRGDIRAYAFCGSHQQYPGKVVFSFLNLRDYAVRLDLSVQSADHTACAPSEREEFRFTSNSADSQTMLLNGVELTVDAEGHVPILEGVKVAQSEAFIVEGMTYGMVVVDACSTVCG